jgi:protein-tyrosine phosphatase
LIDLHNHVLPGVDDGPHDLKCALHMLEIAAGQGITHVACTSHGNDRATDETDRFIQSVFQQLKEAKTQAGIPVELKLGSELMLGADILRVLSLPFATYGGMDKYLLLEFPTETPFEIILNAIRSIRRTNRTPVIAHFERFPRAQRTPDQPLALRAAGAILSLDAGSLTGQFGNVMVTRSRQLLNWGCIDLLASDAHNDEAHGFCMKSGYEAAAQIIGADSARKLVLDNPRIIWDGAPWPEEKAKSEEKTV